jgi:hypothetical protein
VTSIDSRGAYGGGEEWQHKGHEGLDMSVFSTLAKYMVVKIARSSSEVVLWTMKHMVIYSGLAPSLKVIALRLMIWYWRWIGVIRGEQRAQEVLMMKGEMDLVAPTWRVGGLL